MQAFCVTPALRLAQAAAVLRPAGQRQEVRGLARGGQAVREDDPLRTLPRARQLRQDPQGRRQERHRHSLQMPGMRGTTCPEACPKFRVDFRSCLVQCQR